MKDEKYNLYYDYEMSLYEYLFGINHKFQILNCEGDSYIIDFENNNNNQYINCIQYINNSESHYYETTNIENLFGHHGEYVVNNKGIKYYEDNIFKYGNFIIKFKVYDKYFELNSTYKEDENFKELIKKYF